MIIACLGIFNGPAGAFSFSEAGNYEEDISPLFDGYAAGPDPWSSFSFASKWANCGFSKLHAEPVGEKQTQPEIVAREYQHDKVQLATARQ